MEVAVRTTETPDYTAHFHIPRHMDIRSLSLSVVVMFLFFFISGKFQYAENWSWESKYTQVVWLMSGKCISKIDYTDVSTEGLYLKQENTIFTATLI